MLNILITGKGSYVGQNIKKWLEQNIDYKVDELDLINEEWVNHDFSKYHSVIHVAAIVHKAKQKIDWNTYYQINSLLPKKVATLAKEAGVHQFIFFSTMGVYGKGKKLPHGNPIDSNTPIITSSFYGKSKYEAEIMISDLEDTKFKVCILRPPNIYGKRCPGNYLKMFIKMGKYLPLFPIAYEESKQSLLYIDNLCELVRLIIKHAASGIYLPQDSEPVSTVEFMKCIAYATNKQIRFSKTLGVLIILFSKFRIVNKVFGGVSYDVQLSKNNLGEYVVVSFQDAIKNSI